MYKSIIFIVILNFINPAFSQFGSNAKRSCSYPQDTTLFKNCRQFRDLLGHYAVCECSDCSYNRVNITCMPDGHTWAAPTESQEKCLECRQNERRKLCNEPYIPLNMKCGREVITTKNYTGWSSYSKIRSCTCRNTCRPVNVTCKNGGLWDYADQICQNTSQWESSLGDNLNVYFSRGLYRLDCDQGYQLYGDNVATCVDGEIRFGRDQQQPRCVRKSVTTDDSRSSATSNYSTINLLILISFVIAMSRT